MYNFQVLVLFVFIKFFTTFKIELKEICSMVATLQTCDIIFKLNKLTNKIFQDIYIYTL